MLNRTSSTRSHVFVPLKRFAMFSPYYSKGLNAIENQSAENHNATTQASENIAYGFCERLYGDDHHWVLFSLLDQLTEKKLREAIYRAYSTRCIASIHILQYSNGNFGLRVTLKSDENQKIIFQNALSTIPINEQTPGVSEFPNIGITNNAFKISGNAHVIQYHLTNIIDIMKITEGNQLFSSQIEQEILNLIPSVAPNVALQNTPEVINAQNNNVVMLYKLQYETARGLRLEKMALKHLKDSTQSTPLDPEKSQVVVYRHRK